MFKGFDLNLQNDFFEDLDGEYYEIGSTVLASSKNKISKALDAFKDSAGNLLASNITADWFPPVSADIFLSHSHDDEDLAIQLAGWLKSTFGLATFIDSCVWGYSNQLLEMLDDAYCYQPSNGTYNYKKRNRSTAHVHMMLTVALANMLNTCDCIFFLNTPKSIIPSNAINSPNQTGSPWIYAEIAMTRLIEKKKRRDRMQKRSIIADSAPNLTVKYDIKLDHLTPLKSTSLLSWEKQFDRSSEGNEVDALEVLYSMGGSRNGH